MVHQRAIFFWKQLLKHCSKNWLPQLATKIFQSPNLVTKCFWSPRLVTDFFCVVTIFVLVVGSMLLLIRQLLFLGTFQFFFEKTKKSSHLLWWFKLKNWRLKIFDSPSLVTGKLKIWSPTLYKSNLFLVTIHNGGNLM